MNNFKELRKTIRELKERSAFSMVADLNISADSKGSPADDFILWTVETYLEKVEEIIESNPDASPYDFEDEIHSIAEAAPDYGYYEMWQQFTSLAAWQPEVDVFVEFNGSNLTEVARHILTIIADTILRQIHQDLEKAWGEDYDAQDITEEDSE